MNNRERNFNRLCRLTVSLWVNVWNHEKNSRPQSIARSVNHRLTTFMLSIYACLITETSTVIKSASALPVQNPIDQPDAQPRLPIPAVSSLGASPTPAQ